MSPLEDPSAAVATALERPIGAPPLRELAAGRHDACIVVCDITRPVPNKLLLGPIFDVVHGAGIPRERVFVLVATGCTGRARPPRKSRCSGRGLRRPIVSRTTMAPEWTSTPWSDDPAGYPRLDRQPLRARWAQDHGGPYRTAPDGRVLGGRKTHVPWDRRARDRQTVAQPRTSSRIPGRTTGSSKATRSTRRTHGSADMAGCDFIVDVTLDSQRRVTSVVAGDMEQAFLRGVHFIEGICKARAAQPVDIVVTDCGGYPLDTTFYQAIKGMVNCLSILKEGGTIIAASSLTEGLGNPEFESLFRDNPSIEVFMKRILGEDYFVKDQWQVEELAKVRRKARVKMVAEGVAPEVLARCFVEPARDVESAGPTRWPSMDRMRGLPSSPRGRMPSCRSWQANPRRRPRDGV